MKDQFNYFFSYSHAMGYGNVVMDLPVKIQAAKDVRQVEKIIMMKYTQLGNVVILNIVLLSEKPVIDVEKT